MQRQPLLSKVYGLKKVELDSFCTWIKCIKTSSWCSNGSLIYAFTKTCKTSSFNVFVLDLVTSPFGTSKGSLLVFVGWSTSWCFWSYDSGHEYEKLTHFFFLKKNYNLLYFFCVFFNLMILIAGLTGYLRLAWPWLLSYMFIMLTWVTQDLVFYALLLPRFEKKKSHVIPITFFFNLIHLLLFFLYWKKI